MNQTEIIVEFVNQATNKTGHVSFGRRSEPVGYTKVFGPHSSPEKAQTCHVSIEHAYAAVCFSDKLALAIGAKPRRGWSAGPNGGRFQHDILLSEADARFGSAAAFVQKIVEVAKANNVW